MIFAELALGFDRFEDVERLAGDMGLTRRQIPPAALFLAGKAHQTYRRSGGVKTGVPPDFFIGVQAAVEGLALLTRYVGRYRTYFPTVELIAP